MGTTYAVTTAQTTSTATTTTAAATTASVPLTTLTATGTLTTTGSTLLGLRRLRLASQLNRHLPLQDLIAGKFLNGSGGLVGSGKVHESVTHGTVGAGVDGDRGAFTGREGYRLDMQGINSA